jgi:hypothetical protein
MSRWDDLFNKHQIHSALTDLHSWASTEFENSNDQQAIERRRFLKIIESYQKILKNLDNELVPMNLLDIINSHLRNENIWNQVSVFKDSGNTQNLKNANDRITDLLGQFAQLLAISKKSSSEKPIKGLETVVDTFVTTLAVQKKKLDADIQKLNELTTQQQQKIEALATTIETRRTEVEGQLSGWLKQFSEAQNQRTTDYNTWRKQIEDDVKKVTEDQISKTKDKLDKSQLEFDKSVSEYLSKAEEKHQAILDLYELTAGDSVGAGYLKNANDERDQANFWRGAAIAFIIATVAWTTVSYFLGLSPTDDSNIFWAKIIKAISITGVLLFGAAYSAKQSNAHRLNEKRTRWFALEVKAIDPFISSLNSEDQKALKTKLSERLFGQRDFGNEKESRMIDEHALGVVSKFAIDLLKGAK